MISPVVSDSYRYFPQAHISCNGRFSGNMFLVKVIEKEKVDELEEGLGEGFYRRLMKDFTGVLV